GAAPWPGWNTAWRLSPDLLGGLHDQRQLGHLLIVGQLVALHRRGEPALWREAELAQRHVPGRLLDPALELVLGLQLTGLGGHQAEHHLLARRHEPQRGEASRPLRVVLQEEPVHRELGEERLGHEVVPALGRPGGAEVAPAHVGGHPQPRRPVRQRGVDLPDVAQVLVLRVVAAGDAGTPARCRRAGGNGTPAPPRRGSAGRRPRTGRPRTPPDRGRPTGRWRPARPGSGPCWARGWSVSGSPPAPPPIAGTGS